MKTLQYWHEDKFLGTDMNIEEYENTDYEWACPYCGKHTKYIYGYFDLETLDEYPIGCLDCVSAYEDDEDGYSDEFDHDAWLDWEYEKRMLCRGTNYEY